MSIYQSICSGPCARAQQLLVREPQHGLELSVQRGWFKPRRQGTAKPSFGSGPAALGGIETRSGRAVGSSAQGAGCFQKTASTSMFCVCFVVLCFVCFCCFCGGGGGVVWFFACFFQMIHNQQNSKDGESIKAVPSPRHHGNSAVPQG